MGPKNQSWIHKLPTSQSHRNARLLVHLMEFSLNSHSGSVMDFTMKHKPAKLALILRNTDFLAGNSKFYQLPISANRRFSRKTMDFVPKIVAVAKKNSKNIEGVSQELNSIASEKLDFAPARRRVRTAFFEAQQQLDHPLFQLAHLGIRTEEWFERNSKGVEIFCKSWLPKQEVKIKAIVCFCHGYGDTCTFFFDGIAKRIAESGYAVYAIDHPGFGLSEGLHGYIPSFDELVNNVIERYTNIKARPEASGLPRFLLGQSMGGAVAIKAHLKQPTDWDGVVLVAPMCKIAEDVKPAPAVVKILTLISNILPEAKLVPENHLGDLAFRETSKKKMADYNVISYSDQMRLKTAMELLKATKEIESQLEKVSSPLLVLHGAADKVTDPSVSKFLYEKASSKDKTLKLYPEGYHCILEGEPDERIFTVLGDIVAWLDSRCAVK